MPALHTRKSPLVYLLFFTMILLSCTTLSLNFTTPAVTLAVPTLPAPSATPNPAQALVTQVSGEKISYQNGIEVERLSTNHVVLVLDRKGEYGIAFPETWEVGPVSTEFLPAMDEFRKTNEAVYTFFMGYGMENDRTPGFQIYAVDTAPNRFSKDYFTFSSVYMTRDPQCQDPNLTAANFAEVELAVMRQDPKTEIVAVLDGKSAFEVPWVYVETKYDGGPNSAVLYAKTAQTCLKITYFSNAPDVTVSKELSFIAASITDVSEDE